MVDKKNGSGRKFLRPISVAITALLATSAYGAGALTPTISNTSITIQQSSNIQNLGSMNDQLIIKPSNRIGIVATHYSHMSHQSHSSHMSHASHYSGY